MTDPKYIEDGADEGLDEDALSKLPLDHDASKVEDAEIERRYGPLDDKARDIATMVFKPSKKQIKDAFEGRPTDQEVGDFLSKYPTNQQVEDVYQMLKKMAPEVYKAEADFARRYVWADRAKKNGGKEPKRKVNVTNHELGADPAVDMKNYKQVQLSGPPPKDKKDKDLGIWKHVSFNNSHNRRVSYVERSEEGVVVRAVSREMLRAMKPFLIDFAKKHGIRGSMQFRSYGYDDNENHPRTKGDDKKSLERLPPMRRLMLLTAQAFYNQFTAKDFF